MSSDSLSRSQNVSILEVCEGQFLELKLGKKHHCAYWQLSLDQGDCWEKIPGKGSILKFRVSRRNDGTLYQAVLENGIKSTPVQLVVKLKPFIVKKPSDAEICVGQNATFKVKACGDDLHYQWFKDGEKIERAVRSIYRVYLATLEDAGTYKVVVCNSCGEAKTEAELKVHERPVASAGDDQVIGSGSSTTIGGNPTASGGEPPYTYQWTPADKLVDSTESNPETVALTETVEFTVVVTDANECSASDSVVVSIISIPTGSVAGTVLGAQGNPVVGAQVTLNGPITPAQLTRSLILPRAILTTTTNQNGQYEFANVEEGAYDLTIEAPGFVTKTITGLQVTEGEISVGDESLTDDTPPAIVITTPTEGTEYEINSGVLANYSCTDEGSGVASCSGTVANGTPIDTSSLGAKTFTVDAADLAGNTSTLTHNYTVVDTVPPEITIVSPGDGGQYEIGTVVLADYRCIDTGSGVASCVGTIPNGGPLDTTSLGVKTFTVDAADVAGNTSTLTFTYEVVDTIPPEVDVIFPEDGGSYQVGSNILADYRCTDTGSGVASCVGTVPNGDPIDTSTLGNYTFEVTGTDNAGNQTFVSVSYRVEDTSFPVVNFTEPSNPVSGMVTLQATATDVGSGISSVNFFANVIFLGSGLNVGVDVYQLGWDSLSISNGTYSFYAIATDNAGNETLSTAFDLTVSN